jgi:hypothetical protein
MAPSAYAVHLGQMYAPMQVGLLESDADVRSYDASIQNEVAAQFKALMDDATTKWGKDAFAATITAAQLPQFQSDRDFFRLWQAFQSAWAAEHQNVQSTSFFVNSADEYRRLDALAQDANAWRAKIEARGITIQAPPLTTRGAFGATNPGAPGAVKPVTDTVTFVAKAALGLGAMYLIAQLIKAKGPSAPVVVPA